MVEKGKPLIKNWKPVLLDNQKLFASVKSCAEYLHTNQANISKVITGTRKTYKGHKIEYYNKTRIYYNGEKTNV